MDALLEAIEQLKPAAVIDGKAQLTALINRGSWQRHLKGMKSRKKYDQGIKEFLDYFRFAPFFPDFCRSAYAPTILLDGKIISLAFSLSSNISVLRGQYHCVRYVLFFNIYHLLYFVAQISPYHFACSWS